MLRYLLNLQRFAEDSADSSLAMDNSSAEGVTDTGTEPIAEGNEESFDDLIKGKYKEQYDAKVKEAIGKRFKNQKDLSARLESMNPIIMEMANKYGIDTSDPNNIDIDAINNALLNDNARYEEEAFKRGMDVETLKEMKKLEAENNKLRASEEARARDEEGRRVFEKLVADGNAVKQIYPQFDLDAEMDNADFGRLIASGVPMQTAYEVVHKDEILTQGMAYAVQQTASQISASIATNGRRPSENGLSGQAPASGGAMDPSKLTLRDFAELKRRAEGGERITFT